MIKFYQIVFFLIFITTLSDVHSQCDTLRYKKPIFDSIVKYENIKYGRATVWNIPYNKKDLKMNIYTPANDTLSKRPLMIWVHPGGFMLGNKDLEDMVALCDSFARRGYVTATIDYRKWFNPILNSSAERAVYRGTQDLRAAIRYLKEKHNVYGIDTNYTFIGGSSAGAFAVLHTVYIDQNEAPASIAAGGASPALGDLDAEGNNYSHLMDITGYVNLWGAIGDSTWIGSDVKIKGLHIHGKDDSSVPFGVGRPFGVFTIPKVHGSRAVTNQLSSFNIPYTSYFVEGQGHEFHGTSNGDWDTPPTPYWDTIYNLIEDHYASILKKSIVNIIGNSAICESDTVTYKVSLPNKHKVCWEVLNGTILHATGDSAQIVFNTPGQGEVIAHQFSEIAKYNGRKTMTIEVNPTPTINFIGNMYGMDVSFIALPSGSTNQYWTFGDGNTAQETNPTHTYANAGNYNVSLTATDQNGCSGYQRKTMNFSTLDFEANAVQNLKVYPNPVSNLLTISSDQELERLLVYSNQGQLIKDEI